MIMLLAGDAVEYIVSFEKIIEGGGQHIPISVSDDIRGDGCVRGGLNICGTSRGMKAGG